MIDIVLVGCHGRMGQRLASTCSDSGIRIKAGIDYRCRHTNHFPVYRTLIPEVPNCDVLVDFSRPECLNDSLSFCKMRNTPVLLGTTGYTHQQLQEIQTAANEFPIFLAPNLSIGANILLQLLTYAAPLLKSSFDCTIIERHHKNKSDSPSGTALLYAEALACPSEIFSIRSGMIAGEHTVTFAGNGELLQLYHRADNLDVYVNGAQKAIHFLSAVNCPGLYDMKYLMP